MLPLIVIAEHDPAARCVLEMTLRQRVPCRLIVVRYGYEIMAALQQHADIALVITDIQLPDMTGLEALADIQRHNLRLPVMVAASARDDALVQTALKQGAVEFIRKTDDPARLAMMVKSALAGERPRQQLAVRGAALPDGLVINVQDPFAELSGQSSAIQGAIEQARRAAASDIPVLLKGESGVGKERFARAIHEAGARAGKPFVAVNCGAIPANLVESTLFGHAKGAFTGATGASPGKFREAEGGTLLLDEVGELPLDIQVKLLRALQEKEVQPVGGGKPVKVDIRIISASHVDLEQAMSLGHFREDLYYRLHVFPVEIPPLRMRGRKDVEVLIGHFVRRFAEQEGKQITKVSDAAMGLLGSYSWPGNIRQLENAIYRAVVMAKGELLLVEDFVLVSNALHQRQLDEMKHRASSHTSIPQEAVPDKKHSLSLLNSTGEFRTLREVEAEIMQRAIHYYRWHITHVAQALGITRATVYKKMKEAGIQDPRDHNSQST